jgi:riboflavin kinase/FMN adenylyltransferase
MATVLKSFEEFPFSGETSRPSVICLGNFDGVHRGHQSILAHCLQEARLQKSTSIVFSFWPHPRRFFNPTHQEPRLLLSREERIELLSMTGVDFVVLQNFDETFSKIEARDFVETILHKRLGARLVIVGRDFRFGHRARGTPDLLRSSGLFDVLECRDEKFVASDRDFSISSSLVRQRIAVGDLESAQACLGYPPFLTGEVVRGDARGETLNARTANIQGASECHLPAGVYVTMLQDLATKHFFAGVSNLGFAPSFDRQRFCVETHLLGFDDNLYERQVRLFFLSRLRDEKKFSSPEELKMQIQNDIDRSLELFAKQKLFHRDSMVRIINLLNPAAECQNFTPLNFLRNLALQRS